MLKRVVHFEFMTVVLFILVTISLVYIEAYFSVKMSSLFYFFLLICISILFFSPFIIHLKEKKEIRLLKMYVILFSVLNFLFHLKYLLNFKWYLEHKRGAFLIWALVSSMVLLMTVKLLNSKIHFQEVLKMKWFWFLVSLMSLLVIFQFYIFDIEGICGHPLL